jgi:23S rRNA pseudouridine1911/1915/1917 synthase
MMEIVAATEEIATLSGTGEVRLDRYLSLNPGGVSRQHFARAARNGLVQVNGRRAKPSTPVRPGDVIVLAPESLSPEPGPDAGDGPAAEDLPLTVLHRDDHLLVIDKPPGICVHPGAGHTSGTLVNALLHHYPDITGVGTAGRPGIVHRLDKDTSGLLLVALDTRTHQELSRLFRSREIHKEYRALVWGTPDPVQGTVDTPIGRSPSDRKRMSVLGSRGRNAVTDYRVLERAGSFSLLGVRLHTGRTHQIRVHLSHLGHPVVGDPLYGGKRWKNIVDPSLRALLRAFPRQALHAHRLAFRHPETGAPVEYTSPLPVDIRDLLDGITGRLA